MPQPSGWGAGNTRQTKSPVTQHMDRLEVRTGIDLVRLAEFQHSLQDGGEALLRRLFHPSEVQGASVERLAGIFAAKEAAYKALSLPKGDWHVIEIRYTPDGKPSLAFGPEYDASRVVSCDLSISHHGEYVVASVVALLRA
ncbi:MAG: holo-ACP synthase [Chloroflexi bacterium]|nr:holo-ACP synthase [Chloroflexota bacterium]MBI4198395.1 holo-ACP synthase [Chloroflexota bacterium]